MEAFYYTGERGFEANSVQGYLMGKWKKGFRVKA